MKHIPQNVQHLFWDINIDTFNPIDYPEYTISRVLEFGDEVAATWIKEVFSESVIKQVIKSDRKLSPKSANFWAIKFGIPLGEIASLKNNGRSTI